MVSCDSTEFGCCPNGHTVAPGPNGTGCPSKIRRLFSDLFFNEVGIVGLILLTFTLL